MTTDGRNVGAASEERFVPPVSGVLLGSLVEVLALRQTKAGAKLNGSTPRRLFRGEGIKDDSRRETVAMIAAALVELGLGLPPLGLPDDVRPREVLVGWLEACALRWDQLAGAVRSDSCVVLEWTEPVAAFLRLVAVDMAVRHAAMLLLGGLPAPPEGVPDWARERGGGLLARALTKQTSLTRDALAAAVEVSPTTIDAWLGGTARPTDANLDDLAFVLSNHGVGTQEDVLARLRRHAALAVLVDQFGRYAPRERLEEIAAAHVRFVRDLHRELEVYFRSSMIVLPGFDRADAVALLVAGADAPRAHPLLAEMHEREAHRLWRAELEAVAARAWLPRLQHVLRVASGKREAAAALATMTGLSPQDAASLVDRCALAAMADLTTVTPADLCETHPDGSRWIRVKGDAAFSARNRMVQAMEADQRRDYPTAVVHTRRAVELMPLDPKYQFFLGAFLGLLIIHERPADWRDVREDALRHLDLAIQLDPRWPTPRREIGILFMNTGEPDRALEYLERASGEIEPDVHFLEALGESRFRAKDLEGARAAFEQAVALQPNHGPALDRGALCSFLLGDGPRGQELAKRAKMLGCPGTHDLWRSGKLRELRQEWGADHQGD